MFKDKHTIEAVGNLKVKKTILGIANEKFDKNEVNYCAIKNK